MSGRENTKKGDAGLPPWGCRFGDLRRRSCPVRWTGRGEEHGNVQSLSVDISPSRVGREGEAGGATGVVGAS